MPNSTETKPKQSGKPEHTGGAKTVNPKVRKPRPAAPKANSVNAKSANFEPAGSTPPSLEISGSEISGNERLTLFLTNCTDSPRGIAFKRGIVILEPREMRLVPAEERDEVRALFQSRTFQRFVDNGIFRLNELSDDEACTVVKTPAPPAELIAPVWVDGALETEIGPATGGRASSPKIVEYQQGGPLGDAAAE